MASPVSGTTSSSSGIPSLGDTFGVLLLSIFISTMFYGVTLAQTIRYARLYPSDRPFLKVFVATIFIVDTLHSASMIHICYHYLVTNYLNASALSVNVWTLDLLPLSTGITVLLTQGFYTRRIYIVSYGYRPIVILIVGLLFVEFGFMAASSIARSVHDLLLLSGRIHQKNFDVDIPSFRDRTFEAIHKYIWMDTVLFGVATVVDVVLTGAFITILRRGRTGFLGTDSALDMLSRYALYATGLISALTVPAFISSLALSRTFVYFAIAIPAVKVYSNSVLAVLNCRSSLPRPGNATSYSGSEHAELSTVAPGRRRGRRSHARRATVVQSMEAPCIVIDISAESGEDAKELGGQYAECEQGKDRTNLDSSERIV